tara:strand:+ start:996 stop:1325 length:330 start_codon:yes stop_codon:yes gene_type:complete
MKKLLLILALSVGCAAKQPQITGPDYESSGIPCLDALQINIDASGCTQLRLEQVSPSIEKITCAEREPYSADPWNMFEFVIHARAFGEAPLEYQWMCSDPFVDVYVNME